MFKKILSIIKPKIAIFESRNKWGGIILATVKNASDDKIKHRKILFNQITNNALDEIVLPLYGGTPDMEIKELAVGDGTTTASGSDEALDNETYRVSDTDLDTTDTGQVTTEFVLQGTEYLAVQPSGVINEIGIYAGSAAAVWGGGAGKDTGLLIARVLWSYTMTANENIYFQRIDTVSS